MDNLSNAARSENMRRIRSRDTSPEVAVRSLIHSMGFRFRLHRKDLPGCPDIVFPGLQKTIFVHGCFWHQHAICGEGRLPKSRQDYWEPKLKRNMGRDVQNRAELRKLGWRPLVVWECELKRPGNLEKKLWRFLEPRT
jgi:DNA mismatch endonuclease (patch repair protein)